VERSAYSYTVTLLKNPQCTKPYKEKRVPESNEKLGFLRYIGDYTQLYGDYDKPF